MAADALAEAVRPAADAAAPAGGERFRLNRYFAIASLLCTLLTAAAQGILWQTARQWFEPPGAAALAALLSGVYRPEKGERVAVLVCGANPAPGPF